MARSSLEYLDKELINSAADQVAQRWKTSACWPMHPARAEVKNDAANGS
jgi:hypothetical protein